jgi:Carboxypeptidase regulatory-like domain
VRKDRNRVSPKILRSTLGPSSARQNTCGVNSGHTDNGQLRISRPVWTIGAPATPDGEFRLLAVERTRNILAALKTASVLGLLILSMGSVAASQRNSPDRLEQGPTTPAAVFGVSGVVLDPSNAAIAGAKVTLYGGSLKNEPSTTTDLAGHFQFSGVLPGSYEVEVQQEGFKILRSRVKVGPRSPAPLRIVLPLRELHEEITVTNPQGKLSRDATENADIIRLDRQALDSLPIQDNDVVKAVTEMLGPGSGGSRGAVLIVDGVVASEVGVPASAIQEVRINQNPYSAEYSAPGKNRIEIITKNGSSDYHGSLDASFRDYRLDARNAFAHARPPERLRLFDGYFSGPLGKSKKTTFQVSASQKQDDQQSIVYAQVPSGAFSQNFPNPQRSTYFLAGINRELGKGNNLAIRYSYFNWSDKGNGVGGVNLPEAASDESSSRHYLYVSDRAAITPNLLNEFSVRATTSDSITRSVLQGQPRIVVLDAFVGGSGQTNYNESHNYLQLNDTLSWSHGKHLIKAGINLPELGRYGLNDRSNFDGTFQFSSLQGYIQGIPFSFVQQQGTSQLMYWQKEVGLFVQDEMRVRPGLSIAFGLRYDWQNYISNPKNFAPRLSFAFAPGKSRKVVFRGGVGIFYETTGQAAIADMLRFNGQGLLQIVLSKPSYPNPFTAGGMAQTLPSSIVRFAPDLRLPYNLQYSFGVETQLQKSTTFTATYIGDSGFNLFRSRDLNAPLPPRYVQRPNPDIATLREIESDGNLASNALKLAVRTKISRFFNGMAQYTLGRSYDDTAGIAAFPANQYDLTGEWSRSNFDSLHFFYFYGTLNASKGVSLGASLSVRSGQPYTMTTGTDYYGTTFGNARPAGVPRNSLEGPGSATLNLRLAKTFTLIAAKTGKRKKDEKTGLSATAAVDAFNVLSHVNFGRPVGNLSSPFFGHSISAGPPRRLQVLVRFQF